MASPQWERVQEIFLAVVDRPPTERAPLLDSLCQGDAELRAEVESLVTADQTGGTVLDASLDDLAGLVDDEPEPAPKRVGPYLVVREIGRGGMGTVYLAERDDEQFHRRVAVKVVRRGLDTDDVIARFRAERQILATLEHPGIARLYDGGVTDDGRPYLVMEYVDGSPVDRYCRERGLAVRDRIELVRSACDAVSFAHRNLIVHRDLKPSNILVTDEGEVKLLDFGIAKLLDPSVADTEPLTRAGSRILTPEYASPEQRRGETLTTASDVYSLGVVLHELLTGTRPPVGTPGEADALPTRPSRAVDPARVPVRRGELEGDLDAIILAALHPDPGDRLPSADALADDLRRHVSGRPIRARPPAFGYRAGKFVKRNRVPLAAAAFAAISLAGGLAAALSQARRARAERDAAVAVSGFLEGLFTASVPFGGPPERLDTLRVRDFLARGVDQLQRDLEGDSALRGRMSLVLGKVHQQLGLAEQAEPLLREGLLAARAQHGASSPEAAEALRALARFEAERGAPQAAESLYVEALALRRDEGDALEVATVEEELSRVLMDLNRLDEAEALLLSSTETRRRELPDSSSALADNLNALAALRYRNGEFATAAETMTEAVEAWRKARGRDHPNVAIMTQNLAFVLNRLGRYEEADTLFRRATEDLRRVLGPDHPMLGALFGSHANVLDRLGRVGEADSLHQAGIQHLERVLPGDSRQLSIALHDYGGFLKDHGRYDEAEAYLRRSMEMSAAVLGPDSPDVAIVIGVLAENDRARGRPDVAEAGFREARAQLERSFPGDHPRVLVARRGLARALADQGRFDEAEVVLRATLEAAEGRAAEEGVEPSELPDVRETWSALADVYEAWGRPDEARRWRERAAVDPSG